MLDNIHKLHFIGIGGAGMSSIAIVLLEMGYKISGSDIAKSEITAKLESMGAKVFLGHNYDNIQDVDAIVVSTAIPASNPEIKAARDKGITVFHRADIVAALIKDKYGIAVAGAHGKTTTTSMISLMFERTGQDPTIIIGAEAADIGSSGKYGRGRHLIAEADESDGSFLKLSPHMAVITNIENDHMDYYGTMENILQAFENFIHRLPQDSGLAVLCFDNENVRNIAGRCSRRYVSYAVNYEADYVAKNVTFEGAQTSYEIHSKTGGLLGQIHLRVPGIHNVSNSLAAMIVGLEAGLDFEAAKEALAEFTGAKRRFQTKGRVNDVWVVDDYAHHPTEITTTLLAAKQTQPNRLICVFQPHRYSRTKLLRREFGKAFFPADILILTDIYSAGEAPIEGITGMVLKDEVESQTGQHVTYIKDKNEIAAYLENIVKPGDLVLTMGAGNIYKVGEELVERL